MDDCKPHHDWVNNVLTAGLCLGIAASYLPQHYRIIKKKSSEGFSPWFLLLGSTSAAASLLNIITMQWGVLKCCKVLSAGSCLELTGGVFQVGITWLFFTIILILYIIYFPPHLKYIAVDVDSESAPRRITHIQTNVPTDAWRTSVLLAWAVLAHISLATFTTVLLLRTGTPRQLDLWATFLGVSAACCATIQYAPQLMLTYRAKLVGALSVPSMCIQSPGGLLVVASIAMRPGTNWTSWITFAVAAALQGLLLGMCIIWKFRQRRLEIDDFGHPLGAKHLANDDASTPPLSTLQQEDSPVPITHGPDDAPSIGVAVGDAVHEDVRTSTPTPLGTPVREVAEETEETPLLGRKDGAKEEGWFGWVWRR